MVVKKNGSERNLVLWQPFVGMGEAERRFRDLFGEPFMPSTWRRPSSEDLLWSPAIDVVEKDDKFLVKVEVPGVDEKDLDIHIDGDMLTISGEKRAESEVKKDGYSYSESSYGNFSRSITVPSTVDTAKIEACYDKGVLEICLPKAQEAKPKKVKVALKEKQEPIENKREVAGKK